MGDVELSGQSTSVVHTRIAAFQQDLSCGCIVEVPGVGTFFFMYLKHFESRVIGVMVCHVDGITMTKPCGIEQFTVVVKGSRTPDDFVTSVSIHICHRHVVVAVAIHGAAPSATGRSGWGIGSGGLIGIGDGVAGFRLRCVEPALFQLLSVEIHSPDESVGVVAATENAAGIGVGSLQMGYGSQIAFATIAVGSFVVLAGTVVPVERT